MKTLSLISWVCSAGIILGLGCKGSGNGEEKKGADSTTVAAKPVPGAPIKYDSSKRYIFLTWDDAPQPPGTNICKNVFHQQGVKATFFVVGFNANSRARKRIVDSLRDNYPEFLIANHSYSHAYNKYKEFYAHPDSAINDFLRNEKELSVPVKIIRLPGNNSWVGKGEMRGPKSTMPVCKRLDSMGYNVIGWDIEWRFKNVPHVGSIPEQSVDALVKEINDRFDNDLNNEPNAVVILAHDRMFEKPQYVDSLTKFISVLKQDPRNAFETIDHYPLVQRK
jgi:peptidoglycan/xylan/chitin deacetylase (PgdA/CDA1 family)